MVKTATVIPVNSKGVVKDPVTRANHSFPTWGPSQANPGRKVQVIGLEDASGSALPSDEKFLLGKIED
jgi:hypothetical protein